MNSLSGSGRYFTTAAPKICINSATQITRYCHELINPYSPRPNASDTSVRTVQASMTSFRVSLMTLGLPLPPNADITLPTKNPNNLVFPCTHHRSANGHTHRFSVNIPHTFRKTQLILCAFMNSDKSQLTALYDASSFEFSSRTFIILSLMICGSDIIFKSLYCTRHTRHVNRVSIVYQ